MKKHLLLCALPFLMFSLSACSSSDESKLESEKVKTVKTAENESEKEAREKQLFLEIQDKLQKISEMTNQVSSSDGKVLQDKEWRRNLLKSIEDAESHVEKIKSTDLYKNVITSNEDIEKPFIQIELQIKAARLMYESVVEENGEKMDKAMEIMLFEIPALEEGN